MWHESKLSTQTSTGDSWTLTGKSDLASYGDTAPFFWFLVHTKFCLCHPRVCFPSLVEILQSNPTSLQSPICCMFSVPLSDLQIGKSAVVLRTFLTEWEFLCYNCSAFFDSSAWWLYGGVNGDLLQEDLCHTLCDPGLLQPVSLSLWQTTADRASTGDTQIFKGRSGLVSVRPLGPGAHKVLFEPSKRLWQVWGLILKASSSPSYPLVGVFPFALRCGVSFFVVSNILLSIVVQQRVAVLEFLHKKMSNCPSTSPSCHKW